MALEKVTASPASPEPKQRVTGEAMDVRIVPKKRPWFPIAMLTLLVLGLLGFGLYSWFPQGLVVSENEMTISKVERGVFRDDIAVRASAGALKSVVLDAVDRGRVEVVSVKDGAIVQQGQLLFRLSNPQRRMDLLQRQSEQAQQISNLSTFNVSSQVAQSDSKRRLETFEFNVRETEKVAARNARLAAEGFISQSVYQDSVDKLEQAKRELREEKQHSVKEAETRQKAIKSLEDALLGLRSGLKIFEDNIDALSVRAPISGRLTDFRLQVGEAVRADQRIGRIDEPDSFKLSAQVDEYYLPRVAIGYRGSANVGGKDYPVEVKTIFPQVKEGRFVVDLVFSGDKPAGLNPGMSVDLRIILGEPTPALILPNGPFINDTGGAWVYVLDPRGERAERRTIRIGRRNIAQVEVVSGLNPGDRVIVSSYAGFGKAERLQLSR